MPCRLGARTASGTCCGSLGSATATCSVHCVDSDIASASINVCGGRAQSASPHPEAATRGLGDADRVSTLVGTDRVSKYK